MSIVNLMSNTILLPFRLFSSLVILLKNFFSSKSDGRLRLPPSPEAVPVTGHFHLIGSSPHSALFDLSKKYGPIYRIQLGSISYNIVSSPELARDCLYTHDLNFAYRPQFFPENFLGYEHDLAFAPYGPYWKLMRKIWTTKVLSARSLSNFIPLKLQVIREFLNCLLKASGESKAVDVSEELRLLVGDVVLRMSTGMELSAEEGLGKELRILWDEMISQMFDFNVVDLFKLCAGLDDKGVGKRLEMADDKSEKIMEEIVKQREEMREKNKKLGGGVGGDGKANDLLDMMLDICETETTDMDLKEHFKVFIRDLFVTGSINIATEIEWVVAELLNHPNMMRKAREEIDSVVGKERLVDESDIPNLPYLNAIIKETLRFHPIDPMIMREAKQDCKIDGYDIPAKSRLLINIWALSRDPNHWENPDEFNPERFMGEGDKNNLDVRGQHYHFLPFGSGKRGCPSITIAMQLLHITIATLIQCFDLNLKTGDGDGNGDGKENAVMDMSEVSGLVLYKAKRLICVPVARFHELPPSTQQSP